jgi:antitoxin CcdA
MRIILCAWISMTIQAPPLSKPSKARQSAKRATNLSLSADVLDAAKALQINVSQVCDAHLREVVRLEQERRWRADHADFVAAYNSTIETDGLPLEEWRGF